MGIHDDAAAVDDDAAAVYDDAESDDAAFNDVSSPRYTPLLYVCHLS